MNRPSALDRIVSPSGSPTRGASGLFSPTLSGADINPYPDTVQGLTDCKINQNVRLVSHVLCATAINGGPPFDDNAMFWPGCWGNDVTLTGTVYRQADSGTATSQEVGFLICATPMQYSITAYEVMIAVHPTNLYCDVVRWNGVQNQYDIFQHTTAGLTATQNGWRFRAQKVGNLIRAFLDTGGGLTQVGADVDITAQVANAYGPTVYAHGLVGVNMWQRGGQTSDLTTFGWQDPVTILAS